MWNGTLYLGHLSAIMPTVTLYARAILLRSILRLECVVLDWFTPDVSAGCAATSHQHSLASQSAAQAFAHLLHRPAPPSREGIVFHNFSVARMVYGVLWYVNGNDRKLGQHTVMEGAEDGPGRTNQLVRKGSRFCLCSCASRRASASVLLLHRRQARKQAIPLHSSS